MPEAAVVAVGMLEKMTGPEKFAGPVKFGVAAVRLVKLPKDVNEELTTEDPRDVAVTTSAPSILYVCPDATSKLSSVFNVFAADL